MRESKLEMERETAEMLDSRVRVWEGLRVRSWLVRKEWAAAVADAAAATN